ncbi:hypothetical protein C8J57DRAFT_1483262 [Mycena rebaudengoi]|nr:hypothetical protein C8J57DRAFT_1483262 [Mycena rebaudengoi]
MTVTQNRLQNLLPCHETSRTCDETRTISAGFSRQMPRNPPVPCSRPHRHLARDTSPHPPVPATDAAARTFPPTRFRRPARSLPPAPSHPRLPRAYTKLGSGRHGPRCVALCGAGLSWLLTVTDNVSAHLAASHRYSAASSSSCFIGGALGRIPARVPTRKCDFNGSPAALFAPQRSSAVDRSHHAPVHGSQLSAPSLSLLLYPFAPYSYPAHPLQIPLRRPLRRTRRSYNDGPSLTPHRLHGRTAVKSVVATGLYLLESPRTADLTRARLSIMLTEAGASDPQDGDEQQGGPINRFRHMLQSNLHHQDELLVLPAILWVAFKSAFAM